MRRRPAPVWAMTWSPPFDVDCTTRSEGPQGWEGLGRGEGTARGRAPWRGLPLVGKRLDGVPGDVLADMPSVELDRFGAGVAAPRRLGERGPDRGDRHHAPPGRHEPP